MQVDWEQKSDKCTVMYCKVMLIENIWEKELISKI